MVPSVPGSEASEALLVGEDELGLEGGQIPIGQRTEAKFLSSSGQKAGFLDHC